jgi:hypothetical protein
MLWRGVGRWLLRVSEMDGRIERIESLVETDGSIYTHTRHENHH